MRAVPETCTYRLAIPFLEGVKEPVIFSSPLAGVSLQLCVASAARELPPALEDWPDVLAVQPLLLSLGPDVVLLVRLGLLEHPLVCRAVVVSDLHARASGSAERSGAREGEAHRRVELPVREAKRVREANQFRQQVPRDAVEREAQLLEWRLLFERSRGRERKRRRGGEDAEFEERGERVRDAEQEELHGVGHSKGEF